MMPTDMRRWTLALAVAWVTLPASQAQQPSFRPEIELPKPQEEVIDPADFPEVIARVNGQPVYRAELVTQAEIIRAQVRQAGGADPAGQWEFYQQVLEGLVGEILIYQHAQTNNLGASQEEVNRAFEGFKARFEDEAALDTALAAQGIDRQRLREQLQQTLSIQSFIEKHVGGKVVVSDTSKRNFYEANASRLRVPERRRVQHILQRVPDPEDATERRLAEGRARVLRSRIESGEDMAELARQYSEDEASKERGGILPAVLRTGRRPEFESAVFTLQAGDMTIVETPAGFHLIRLIEVLPARQRPYEEVAAQIEKRLREERIQAEVARQMETFRADAKVEVLIGPEAAR